MAPVGLPKPYCIFFVCKKVRLLVPISAVCWLLTLGESQNVISPWQIGFSAGLNIPAYRSSQKVDKAVPIPGFTGGIGSRYTFTPRLSLTTGLIALDHLDEVIQLIRRSATPEEARQGLIQNFSLTPTQAQAILDLRLQRLTALEREKIQSEYRELQEKIAYYKKVLADPEEQKAIIRAELQKLETDFGDARRTQILPDEGEMSLEDTIPNTEVAVIITHQGYLKRTDLNAYRSQARGGVGARTMDLRDEDFVEHHTEVRPMGRTAAGVIGMDLDESDQVVALLPIWDPGHALFVLSENGYGKATPLEEFRTTHRGGKGIRAFQVTEKTGPVVAALELRGDEELMLVTREKQSIRFSAKEIRILGRATQGSRLMRLKESDQIASVSRRVAEEEE